MIGRRSLVAGVAIVGVLGGCQVPSGLTGTPASPGHESHPAVSASVAAESRAGIPAGAQRAVVRWISDGDTIGVRATASGTIPQGVDTTIRLLEIDTPESKDPDRPVECFAREATRATTRLLPRGSEVWLEYDRDLRDRYGRTLAYVWNADGVFVNERLVGRGLARAVYFRPNDRHLEQIRAAEQRAKAAGRGLWSHC